MPVTIDIPTTSPSADWLGADWDPDTEPVNQLTVHRSLFLGSVYRVAEVDARLAELSAEVEQLAAENVKLTGDTGSLDARERALATQYLDLDRRRADAMAQGQAAADGMINRARAAAAQIVADAKHRAAGIETDAQRRATSVLADARHDAEQIIEDAVVQADHINPIPAGDIIEQAEWALDHSGRVLAAAQAGADAHAAAVGMLTGTARAVAGPREAPGVELVELASPAPAELTAGAAKPRRAARTRTAT